MTTNNALPSEQIQEGNKQISEFMGYRFSGDGKRAPYTMIKPGEDDWVYGSWPLESFNEFVNEYFKYHSLWDWLMPVCKKIIEMYADMRQDIFSGLCKCDISLTWTAVVAFIKFWNDPAQEKLTWNDFPKK